MQFARYFRLEGASGAGVRCDDRGLFVGATPLLERARGRDRRIVWRPRPLADLDRALGQAYGLPVSSAAKLSGLASVARALNRGDVAHAQIAALLLRLPDLPTLMKIDPNGSELVELASRLEESGLLIAGDASVRPRLESAVSLADETELSPVRKFNPYHDERGRFTTAGAAVEPSENQVAPPDRVDVAAEQTRRPETVPGDPSREASSNNVGQGTALTSLAAFVPLSCSDAFRACVQTAAFQRPALISNCIAALRVCKSTGLPTIFGPGLVGIQ